LDKLAVTDLELANKRVLVRVDFNVPLNDTDVSDDTRLRASLPTIRHILEAGGLPVLMSHLGRPDGEHVDKLSLEPVGRALQELLGHEVVFVPDTVGPDAVSAVKSAEAGTVVLLENLRFQKEEEENAPAFAMKFSELGDVYVNDAFGTAHRAHASTEGVTHYFTECAAGLLMQKELDYLGGALDDPAKPCIAVMGGAKVSGKIDVIESLLPKIDSLLIGGGMAYTFFKVMGLEIGKSLLEEEKMGVAEEVLKKAQDMGVQVKLPVDCVVAPGLGHDVSTTIVAKDGIPPDQESADIGPETRERFDKIITSAKTALWNGPMGVYEMVPFSQGTKAVAESFVKATENGAITIVGGGETAAAVADLGLADRISHVSTGGGASLEFLEGKELPGVVALSEKP
jgi:phosphoglycerate kinase